VAAAHALRKTIGDGWREPLPWPILKIRSKFSQHQGEALCGLYRFAS